jgi:AcrR family transcriptional regulator
MVKLRENEPDSDIVSQEFRARGIDFEAFHHSISKNYSIEPLIMRLIFATLTFYMAGFHKTGKTLMNPPAEAEIATISAVISEIIEKGLGFNGADIDALDYKGLENRIAETADIIRDEPLLKAVAGAVAKAGPWEASMEQVARRSGLSKSSLYCHFKNKQDMLHQLFMTESLRIIDFARQGIRQSAIPHEQLYLGIISIAEYLRSKPDILAAMDWIRNRKLNLPPPTMKNHGPLTEIIRLFDEIDIPILSDSNSPFRQAPAADEEMGISPWILFLIVNTLMRKKQNSPGTIINEDIRNLFRFITVGINGFKK